MVCGCHVTQRPWTAPGFSRPLPDSLSCAWRSEAIPWVTAQSRSGLLEQGGPANGAESGKSGIWAWGRKPREAGGPVLPGSRSSKGATPPELPKLLVRQEREKNTSQYSGDRGTASRENGHGRPSPRPQALSQDGPATAAGPARPGVGAHDSASAG